MLGSVCMYVFVCVHVSAHVYACVCFLCLLGGHRVRPPLERQLAHECSFSLAYECSFSRQYKESLCRPVI